MSIEHIAANKFIGIADGTVLSFCPSMNLLAVSMNRTSIWVYRLDGERIYSVNNKSPIKQLIWSPDGKKFCLSGADMLCKVYDANSGVLLSTIGQLNHEIMLANWCGYSHNSELKFGNLFKINVLDLMPQLVHELPVPKENTSEYLLEVCGLGELALSFNNILHVPGINLPPEKKYLGHALSSLWNHTFLACSDSQHLQLIDLLFDIPMELREYHMSIIRQLCQILSLVNMIKEVLSTLKEELKSHFQLFDRYISNLNDALYGDTDLTTHFPTPQESQLKLCNSLYDILLTGIIPESLKDYWLNQLGERGIKRLAKLGSSAYDLIRKQCFALVVAAMERIIILLTSLNGISQWLETDEEQSNLGLLSSSLERLLELAKGVIRSIHELMWAVNEEQKLFVIFTNWVKLYIIDKLAKEDDPETYFAAIELRSYKHADILEYLNNYLFSSSILQYFNLRLDLEVLLQLEAPKDIETQFNNFIDELNNELIVKVVSCVKDSVKVGQELQVLESCEGASLTSQDGSLIVKTISDSTIHLIKVSPDTGLQILKVSITLPETVISAEIKAARLVLLTSSSVYIYDWLEAFRSSNHQAISLLHQDAISCLKCADIHHDFQNPRHIAINDDFTLGCILDQNRRSYALFRLHDTAVGSS